METEINGYNLTTHVNHTEIAYDDVGEGRVPVIFLHGFPFDRTMWHNQIDYLKSSYRLIAFDIRGFGRSKDDESTLSINGFANDLLNFMDKLSIDKAVLCGLSMGGYIALNAVIRFPDRFSALVLCDTQCVADTPEEMEKRNAAIAEIKAAGTAGFNEGFIKKVFHKDSLKNKKELVKQLRNIVSANSPHIICQGLSALAARTETCSALSSIRIPTLVMCGREDEVTPLAKSEYLYEKINGSMLRVIDQAGHVSNLEQPAAFNKSLRDFLSSTGGIGVEMFSWK